MLRGNVEKHNRCTLTHTKPYSIASSILTFVPGCMASVGYASLPLRVGTKSLLLLMTTIFHCPHMPSHRSLPLPTPLPPASPDISKASILDSFLYVGEILSLTKPEVTPASPRHFLSLRLKKMN